jgi:glycosyltransferase involved in cell wall biosynthesis
MSEERRVHFKIIVQAYTAGKWIKTCLESIASQKYDNWNVILHVEPSRDNTLINARHFLDGLGDDRFVLVENKKRKLRSVNDIEAIKMSGAENDDVIMFLDGDDWFYDACVLSYLASVYRDENVWVTWGSYIHSHDNTIGKAAQQVSDPEEDPYNGRRYWRYSHLKTFRYFLYKGIRDSDLRKFSNGAYYRVAWDMALMFPMVEMAGPEHSRFIHKILYVYNMKNPLSNERVRLQECLENSHEIRCLRVPYCKRTKEELCSL